MKYLTLDFYDDFTCIGSDCPDTCCANWGIMVDEESAAFYRNVKGPLGEKLRDGLTVFENTTFIKLMDSKCPFLTEKKLCEIYIEFGQDKMCQTCKIYPRSNCYIGDILFCTLDISCPEAARRLLQRTDYIQFDFREDANPIPVSPTKNDWSFFNTCIQSLTVSIDIMQNRSFSLFNRMGLLVLLSDELQMHIDSGRDCSALFEAFTSPVHLQELACDLDAIPKDPFAKFSFILNFQKHIGDLKNSSSLRPFTSDCLTFLNARTSERSALEPDQLFGPLNTDEYDLQYEQYCIYYLSRNFMGSYLDHSPRKHMALLVYLYCMHFFWAAVTVSQKNKPLELTDQVRIFTAIARTFEHSKNDWKLNQLYQICLDHDMTETSFLLSLLS